MAKGLRASVNKRNKSKLRSRVFGPVETARTERLSAKLLELAQQPKPTRSEMEVDTQADKGVLLPLMLWENQDTNVCAEQQTASTTTVQDKATAEGQSLALQRIFSYPVPASLCCSNYSYGTSDEGSGSDEERQHCNEDLSVACHDGNEELFYTLLGLSSDIAGFDAWGDLQMVFES
jgi:hypothetical protein